jgi:hypothetical protein
MPSAVSTATARPASPMILVTAALKRMPTPAPAMGSVEELGHLWRHRAGHGSLGNFNDPDALSLLGGGRSEFQPDKPGPDHDNALCLRQPGAKPYRIRPRPQTHHAIERGPRKPQGAIPRARRQHEVVILDGPATSVNPAGRTVDAGHPGVREHVDPVRAVKLLPPEQQRCVCRLRRQEGLGERRALVRQTGFVADEHDPAVIAALAERNGRLDARLAVADDDNVGRVHRGFLWFRTVWPSA